MIRTASAVWNGGLKDGKGTVSTETNTLAKANYNFAQRFENAPGTNPEELIAAAHASCYSMALAATLGGAGFSPTSVETKASLTLEKLDLGFTITRIHLDVVAKVPNATPEQFLAAAEDAKRNCPVSRVLNTTITLEAKLG